MSDAMSRRTFVKALAVSAVATSVVKPGLAEERAATTGVATEWSYVSGKQYSDPFNQVDLDAVITLPSGVRPLPDSLRLQRPQESRFARSEPDPQCSALLRQQPAL